MVRRFTTATPTTTPTNAAATTVKVRSFTTIMAQDFVEVHHSGISDCTHEL